MKVVAFNCSVRLDGNTATLLKTALAELENEGIETELVQIGPKSLSGCVACYKCAENKDCKCVVASDPVNEYIAKMIDADGILIGSPTYFADATANARALIERAGVVTRSNGNLLARKAGAAVVAVRRAGAMQAFNSINSFFTIGQMFLVGSSYWNVGIGRNKGEVDGDEEGIETMKNLGKNMAWLLKKINA